MAKACGQGILAEVAVVRTSGRNSSGPCVRSSTLSESLCLAWSHCSAAPCLAHMLYCASICYVSVADLPLGHRCASVAGTCAVNLAVWQCNDSSPAPFDRGVDIVRLHPHMRQHRVRRPARSLCGQRGGSGLTTTARCRGMRPSALIPRVLWAHGSGGAELANAASAYLHRSPNGAFVRWAMQLVSVAVQKVNTEIYRRSGFVLSREKGIQLNPGL